MGMKANDISYALFRLRGSRGEGERMIYFTLSGCFLREEGEGFREILRTCNPLFLIFPNWRDLKGEWRRVIVELI